MRGARGCRSDALATSHKCATTDSLVIPRQRFVFARQSGEAGASEEGAILGDLPAHIPPPVAHGLSERHSHRGQRVLWVGLVSRVRKRSYSHATVLQPMQMSLNGNPSSP